MEKRPMKTMRAKVALLGCQVTEWLMPIEDEDGKAVKVTVADVLAKAKLEVPAEHALCMNGAKVEPTVELTNGAVITIVPEIGGGR